jgi:hypothetical protein
MTIYDILYFESFLDESVDLSGVFPLHLTVQDLLQILSVHLVGAFNSTALSQLHLQHGVDIALLLTTQTLKPQISRQQCPTKQKNTQHVSAATIEPHFSKIEQQKKKPEIKRSCKDILKKNQVKNK